MRDEKINKNKLDEELEKELNKEFKEDLFKLDRCDLRCQDLKKGLFKK